MKYIIKNAGIVNEGRVFKGDVLISEGRIHSIEQEGNNPKINYTGAEIIDAEGKFLLPGIIDDQVHFRDPGLTHKGDLFTESRAAVAGGITSFMEMPNTIPQALTQDLLQQKYDNASQKSLANYSFFMGTSNNNLGEVLKTDPATVCGIKVFLGASTGKMLVDDKEVLKELFSSTDMLIAVHSEDENIIQENMQEYRQKYGDNIPVEMHPLVRSEEACYRSTVNVMDLAEKCGSRLHVLHLSTGKEARLFRNDIKLEDKKITAEVCVHHLWFSSEDYGKRGSFTKWNPAVKTPSDREELLAALLDDRIDIIATDHAPHTLEEKSRDSYFTIPSGAPLVQHSLPAMLEFHKQGKISLEKLVEKMCHAPATLYRVNERGYIREGYHADLVLVDPDAPWVVSRENILYKCGWSPLEGTEFHHSITHTFVNGRLVYNKGIFNEDIKGERLTFNR